MFVSKDGANLFFVFCLVSSLFLLWGFCNGMIDIMDKHFQDDLHLTLSQSAWVQFAHYLGYLLMALPAGNLAIKLGYKGGIIAGLLIVAVGGFWFLPATHIAMFWAFLLGVGVIASGLTFLETVANPYVAILGNPRYAATRINLAQSCNGIGWILGPIAGSMFFYSEDVHGQSTGHETLYIPYVGVSIVVLILAVIFLFSYMPDLTNNTEYPLEEPRNKVSHPLLSRPHFVFAVVAQFLYVAAQAGIFSFFINYMTSQVPTIPENWNSALIKLADHSAFLQTWLSGWFRRDVYGARGVSNKGAANLASAAFALFLLGRLIGAAALRKIPGHRLLALFGAMNVLMTLIVFSKLGWLSVGCVFATYLFMSIMFPTIFALGIYGLGAQTKRASAYLVMAIIGGAILPKLMGYIADRFDMSRSFIVPMVCFFVISYYGFKWPLYTRAASR
jgi:FHS family L-fucose permease-like MFS transporter